MPLPDLTEADYDELYAVLKREVLRVSRSTFPAALTQLVNNGVLEITLTDLEIVVHMPDDPQFGVYRVERQRSRLH